MATEQSFTNSYLSMDGSTFNAQIQDEVTISPADGGDTLTLSEAVAVTGNSFANYLYFQGVTADGSVLLNVSPDLDSYTILVSDNTTLVGASIPAASATTYTLCFAAGTLIATPSGGVEVETLKAGDVLRTADGGTTVVKWLGRQTLATAFVDDTQVCPIRISAGALAPNAPLRDLLVTGDHGLVFDEAIVVASALVNGTTITRVAKSDLEALVTYYHIETEGHAVILAEGAPAETFIDNAGREKFDNFAEYVAMYGREQDDIEPLGLPRAKTAREVPAAIKARIAARVADVLGDLAQAM